MSKDWAGLGWAGWTGLARIGLAYCTLAFRDVARSRWDLELGEMKPNYHVFACNLVTLSVPVYTDTLLRLHS